MGGWPKSAVFDGGATGRPKSILATHACGCSPVGPRPKYFGHEFCFCVRIILATCILATVAKITVPAKTLATEIHQFWPRTSYFGHAWPKYGRILATRNFAAKIIDNFGHLLIFWSRRTKILWPRIVLFWPHFSNFGHASLILATQLNFGHAIPFSQNHPKPQREAKQQRATESHLSWQLEGGSSEAVRRGLAATTKQSSAEQPSGAAQQSRPAEQDSRRAAQRSSPAVEQTSKASQPSKGPLNVCSKIST